MTKANILVDSREPEWVINGLSNYEIMSVKKKMLPVGDIAMGKAIAIERKEVNNLISDITDNSSDRPWSQFRNMKDNFEENIVLVHGTENDLIDDWLDPAKQQDKLENKKNIIRGAALSIELDWEMTFLWVEDNIEFLETVRSIFKRLKGKKKSTKPYSAVKSTASQKERIEAILCQVPHVGPSRADKLIRENSTLKEIVNKSRAELKELMGKKTGESLYEVFNEEIE